MIPFKEIVQLAKALPKCGLQATKNENFCWIIDRQGQKVGSVHFSEGIVNIFETYEYVDQVREAIGEERFEDIRQEFEISDEPPVDTSGDEPELTDYGKQLYQQP